MQFRLVPGISFCKFEKQYRKVMIIFAGSVKKALETILEVFVTILDFFHSCKIFFKHKSAFVLRGGTVENDQRIIVFES